MCVRIFCTVVITFKILARNYNTSLAFAAALKPPYASCWYDSFDLTL